MKALSMAYPDRLGQAVYKRDTMGSFDWAVQVYGHWFYYAGGRLLPGELLGEESEYAPQPFYPYPAKLPEWKTPSPAFDARMEAMMKRRQQAPPIKRSNAFYDALWRAHDKTEAYTRVKTIKFLGFEVLAHYSILEELSLVEERILHLAQINASVRAWVHSLSQVTAWNWRNIAETQSRSYHAYGAAIDLLPRSRKGATYWQWTAQNTPKWWRVPYSKRYSPPDAVIQTFESYGFVWGGKWLTYDTMHFEYRPEILILSGIPQKNLRTLQ